MPELKIKFKNGTEENLDCRVLYYSHSFKRLEFFGYDERDIRREYSIRFSSIEKLEMIFESEDDKH